MRVRKLIIDHYLCPGDVVVMSAAIRDLHLCYPGRFITDVRTACPDIWLNNPYITPLNEDDPDVEYIRLRYPAINRTNTRPGHFVTGYVDVLNVIRWTSISSPLQLRAISISPRMRRRGSSSLPSTVARCPGSGLYRLAASWM